MSGPSALELIANDAWSVIVAVAPLVLVFLAFQAIVLRLPAREVARLLGGTVIAALGLFLFLTGVSLAFLPFGSLIGAALATLANPPIVLAVGIVLGFVTAWGEPAVRILANEIEEASSGSLRSSLVVVAICAGVAVSVGIGLLRIEYDIPISYVLIPGYGAALLVMGLTDKAFVGIAADAGGVATGPLSNSFLLALALGASSAKEGQDPLLHGFGLVALIALAPILSVMILGILMRWKARSRSV